MVEAEAVAAGRAEYHLRVVVVGGPGAGKRSLVRGGVGALQGAGGWDARRVDTGLLEGRAALGRASAELARRWAEEANRDLGPSPGMPPGGRPMDAGRVSLPVGPGVTAEVDFWVLPSAGLARAPLYAAGCASVVAVYDATSRASFQAARAWLRALWGSWGGGAGGTLRLPAVVVANKMDRLLAADGTPLTPPPPPPPPPPPRNGVVGQGRGEAPGAAAAATWVGRDEGIAFAQAYGCSYVETSCVRGQGVVDALREAVLAVTEDLVGVTDPLELVGRNVRVKTFVA